MESDGLYNPPEHAIDGLTGERWSTGKNQAGDEWFEVDFDAEVTLDRVTLQVFNNDTDDYPRQYAVRVSNTSMNFNATPLVSGAGATGHTGDQPARAGDRTVFSHSPDRHRRRRHVVVDDRRAAGQLHRLRSYDPRPAGSRAVGKIWSRKGHELRLLGPP